MPKYFSGRNKRTPQSGLTSDRYQYLSIEQAEPNLGDPPEVDNIPPGDKYQVISVANHPGERYWLPIGGGVQPGAITVREEETILPTDANAGASAGINSITDLNFKGNILTAEGYLDEFGNPGIGVTITAAPVGNDHEVLFIDNGEFGAASGLSYDNTNTRVGIASTQPDQTLDIDGSLFISGNVFDKSKTNSGTENQVLVRHVDGGLVWADQSTTGVSDAAGEKTQVQYHGSDGKLAGGTLLVYDYTNGTTDERVGIGSTQPTRLLDVLGDSRFVGVTTFVGNVYVNGVVTSEDVTNIDSLGIVTAQQGFRATDGGLVVVGVTTLQDTRILHDKALLFGKDDANNLEIKFDGTDSVINDVSSTDLGFKLQQGGNTKLEVTQSGIIVTGVTTTDILSVTGLVTSHLIPSPSTVDNFDLGSESNRWDNIWANNINVGSYSPTSLIVEQLKVTGISTLSNLEVSGMSTFIGLSTFNDGLEVISGLTTFSGITTVSGETLFTEQFSVAGVSTLGIASATHLFVSGLSTFVGFSTFKDDVFVAGVSTFIGFTTFRDYVHVTGVSTFVGFSTFKDVIVGGMSTFVGISSFESDVSFNAGIRDKDGELGNTGWLLESTGDGKVNWVNPQGLTVENAVRVGIGSTDKDSTYYPTFVKNNNKHDNPQDEYLYNTHDFIYSYDGSSGIGSVGIGTDIIAHNTTLNVTGITSFKGNVYFNGTDENNLGVTSLTWQRDTGILKFKDEVKAYFGNGNDLRIYHTNELKDQLDSNGESIVDGRTSYIREKGSGGIVFRTDGSDGPGAFQFFGENDSLSQDWVPLLKVHSGSNARVRLYHTGTERLATIGTGVTITGITTTHSLSVSGIASFWGQVWDETGSPGQPSYLLEATSTGVNWKAPENLTVENANKVGVGTTGAVSVGGTSIYYPTFVDSNNTEGRDLEYLYSGNALTYNVHYVDGVGIGSIGIGTTTPNSTLDVLGITSFRGNVYFNGIDDNDGSVGITSITWKPSSSALEFRDNVKATFGDVNSLTIQNGGSFNHSKIIHENIINGSHLYIRSSDNLILESTSTNNWIRGVQGGATELYWNANGNKKLETTDAGIKVTGLTTTGSLRVDGAFYDSTNSYGANSGYILETNQENGVRWVSPGDLTLENANKVGVGSINAADAGIGTHFITFVDSNNYPTRVNEEIYSTGLFVYDPQDHGRVGIGTTIPSDTLSVSGITSFKGEVYFNNDVTGITSIAWKPSSSALEFKDNVKAVFGNDDDLQIYLETGTGGNPDQSTIYSPSKALSLMSGDRVEIEDEVGNNIAVFHKDGSSDLYYRGTTGVGKKLATSGIGITVTGLTSTTSLMVTNQLYDKDGDSGTAGQVLSSTGAGAVDWIDSDTLTTGKADSVGIGTTNNAGGDDLQSYYLPFVRDNNPHDSRDYEQLYSDNRLVFNYKASADRSFVGIGTTNPRAAILHLESDGPILRLTDRNAPTNNRHWHIATNTDNTLRFQAIDDSSANDGNGSGGGNHFDFYRKGNDIDEFRGVGAGTTWFVVDNKNFNVGIGTTNPIADDINTSLQTNNSILAVGIVTAREYYGSTLNIYDSDRSHKITLQSPATGNLTADYTLTLPVNAGSADGDVLQTDGNGVLSWTSTIKAQAEKANSVGIGTTTNEGGTDIQSYYIPFVRDNNAHNSRNYEQLYSDSKLVYDYKASNDSGKVGINTDILGQELNVFSRTFAGIRVKSSRTTSEPMDTMTQIGGIQFADSDHSTFDNGRTMSAIVGTLRGDLILKTGHNESDNGNPDRVTITPLGHVGIGTTNPLADDINTTKTITDYLKLNTRVLAVGVVTCHKLFVDGNEITDGGGTGNVEVKQYSDDLGTGPGKSTPRTERACDALDAPINVATNSGTTIIGIGSTSNAYGSRYIGDTEPTGNLCEGDIWYDTSASAGANDSTGITRVALIKDAKDWDVNGGGFAEDGWRDRDLTEIEDPQSFVDFNSNGGTKTIPSTGLKPGYWSLQPGTYKIEWSAPALDANRHQTKLVYSTTEAQISAQGLHASASSVEGSTENTTHGDSGTAPTQTRSFGSKVIKITATTWFKIMHLCTESNANATTGFGRRLGGSNDGNPDNIYTEVKIEDLATAVKEQAPAGSDVPVGGIIMYSGTQTELNALTNWKLCDGTTHGSVTTPNLKDKFVIGADSWSTANAGRWETNVTGSGTQSGGSKDAVVVSHTHTVPSSNGDDDHGGTGIQRANDYNTNNEINTTTTGNPTNTGTNANLPPYYALAYIMRIS